MMELFEDEAYSQDDHFEAPPLSVKHTPLPYLAEACFAKPCELPAHSNETFTQAFPLDSSRPSAMKVDPGNMVPVYMKQAAAMAISGSNVQDGGCCKMKPRCASSPTISVTPHAHVNGRVGVAQGEKSLMSCRYALKFQSWSSDAIFPLGQTSSLEKQTARRARCLKRPSVELFHPRQLKAVRHL